MPKSAVEERCSDCGRMLYGSDFERGLATFAYGWSSIPSDGPLETYHHTYDCEKVPRRITRADSLAIARDGCAAYLGKEGTE